MPLLDHFNPPVEKLLPWDSLHSAWATRLADQLNEIMPPDYHALEHTHAFGNLEIDAAAFEVPGNRPANQSNGSPVAMATRIYTPSKPAHTVEALFPDTFEVQVLDGTTLVAAIELISPGNKNRPDARRAFAIKSASYLQMGVCVVILDVVTKRHANLHNEIAKLLEWKNCELPAETNLYAAAYRPVRRDDRAEIDVWTEPCAIGTNLPTMPLRLTGELFVPVEFEPAYQETCRKRRVI